MKENLIKPFSVINSIFFGFYILLRFLQIYYSWLDFFVLLLLLITFVCYFLILLYL